nr:ribonuclease HII [Desulfobacterales bacterium]
MADLWAFEKEARRVGFEKIAGIDEAGRGPLAGPVVSAAVILPERIYIPELDDSKKLSPQKRDRLYKEIYNQAISIGIGIVDAAEIERINILRASLIAMKIAVENLDPAPDFLLVDGIFRVPKSLPQETIKKGDKRCMSISAASIVAKVSRDRMMEIYDLDYPVYGFSRNKGYGTKEHRIAIQTFGCCPIHRKTFRGVKEYR